MKRVGVEWLNLLDELQQFSSGMLNGNRTHRPSVRQDVTECKQHTPFYYSQAKMRNAYKLSFHLSGAANYDYSLQGHLRCIYIHASLSSTLFFLSLHFIIFLSSQELLYPAQIYTIFTNYRRITSMHILT